MNALERRVRGKLAEGRSNPALITWQESAAGIVGTTQERLVRHSYAERWRNGYALTVKRVLEGPNGTSGDYLNK